MTAATATPARTKISEAIETASTSKVFRVREESFAGDPSIVTITTREEARKLALALLAWSEAE